jgi:uncharacterized tellurite resistance protein B-like protein
MTTQIQTNAYRWNSGRAEKEKAEQRLLLKILIGAAWLDGMIQMEERQYLRQVAQEHGLENDPEIYPLLNELRAVKQADCDRWIMEYLGDRPPATAVNSLLEAISALVYADGTIGMEEAHLLIRLQGLNSDRHGVQPSGKERVLRVIRQLYHRWVAVLDDVP